MQSGGHFVSVLICLYFVSNDNITEHDVVILPNLLVAILRFAVDV